MSRHPRSSDIHIERLRAPTAILIWRVLRSLAGAETVVQFPQIGCRHLPLQKIPKKKFLSHSHFTIPLIGLRNPAARLVKGDLHGRKRRFEWIDSPGR